MADEQGALVQVPGKYTIILSTGAAGGLEIEVPLTVAGERAVVERLPAGI